jgi:hypothetical protein
LKRGGREDVPKRTEKIIHPSLDRKCSKLSRKSVINNVVRFARDRNESKRILFEMIHDFSEEGFKINSEVRLEKRLEC